MHGSHHYRRAEELLAEIGRDDSPSKRDRMRAARANAARAMAHIELAKLSFAIDQSLVELDDYANQRWNGVTVPDA